MRKKRGYLLASMDDRKTKSPPKSREMVRLPKCRSLEHSEAEALVHVLLSHPASEIGSVAHPPSLGTHLRETQDSCASWETVPAGDLPVSSLQGLPAVSPFSVLHVSILRSKCFGLLCLP